MADRIASILSGERYVFVCALILALINLFAFVGFEKGYDTQWTLITMQVCALIWVFGVGMRASFPSMPGLYIFEAVALITFIGIQAALASATIAPYTGAYADDTLARMDSILMPFVTWPQAIDWLITHPRIFRYANYVYTSINWQLPVLLGILVLLGRGQTLRVLALGSGISAIIGIAIFALMPAQGAYLHYGYTPSDLPDLMIGLPFEFPVILESLKNGSMDQLSHESVSGLISFPSFHASSAIVLAMVWREVKWVGVPMMALNAGVALSAMPIGSHYFSDIVAGLITGYVSYSWACKLISEKEKSWVSSSATASSKPTARARIRSWSTRTVTMRA